MAVIAVAILVRLSVILVLESYQGPDGVYTYEHGTIAANLVSGQGFRTTFLKVEGPTSQQAPFYPLLVAVAYGLAGVESPAAMLLIQGLQALSGGVLAASVMCLADRIAPARPPIAWMAGLGVAISPVLIYSVTHIQVACWATIFFVGTVTMGYRTAHSGRIIDAAGTGITLALLVLTDPILGLAALGVGWAVLDRQISTAMSWRRRLTLLATVASIVTVGVLPWTVRNTLVHGEFVPIKSTLGYAFWQGNTTLSQGTDKVLRDSEIDRVLAETEGTSSLAEIHRAHWRARHVAGYIDDIALTEDAYRWLATMSEPARCRALGQRALAELAESPGRYPKLCLQRLRYFLLFDETNPKARHPLYRVSHALLNVAALMGLIAMGPQLRRRLGPTWLSVAAITLFHTLTIVSVRFHIPLEPLMILWAAVGLDQRARRWVTRGVESNEPSPSTNP